MTARLLPLEPVVDLDGYVNAGGGRGLDAARRLGASAIVEHLSAAGLRGRGGAGFPTGRKWESVRQHASATIPATVVVNAAEGEPGTFKDRALLRTNPYLVVEGALIAALAVGADDVIVATKEAFAAERELLTRAIDDVTRAGWSGGVTLRVFAGPGEYLYGEETGLLEVIDGRPPLPRIAPPYRHGVEEVTQVVGRRERQVLSGSDGETAAPPTLVNNVETIANVPGILAEGPRWFREVGTDASPGTIICTISGDTARAGVGEVAMGTPLRDVIRAVGGGSRKGRTIRAVMSGVANPLLTDEQLDTPVSFEGMEAVGSGLGAAGFIVFDDATDLASVARGVSRFLAVESCGQCAPCKQDGLALADLLDRVRRSDARDTDLLAIDDHLRTITDGARCFLATQHQQVIGSIATRFADDLRVHAEGKVEAAPDVLIAPIVDLVDGTAVLDENHARKQPDWTFDPVDSGQWPAQRLADDPDETPAIPGVHLAEPPVTNASSPAPETRPEAEPEPEPVHGTPVDEVDDDSPDARLYTSAPIETDEGTVVIRQQPVGPDNEQGGGEFPDPRTRPQRPAPDAD